MATATARAAQRKAAVNRLIASANALAAENGIEPPVIPTHHKDTAHLPTLQLDAIAAFLEQLAGAVTVPEAATEDDPDAKPKAAAKPRTRKAAAKPKAEA